MRSTRIKTRAASFGGPARMLAALAILSTSRAHAQSPPQQEAPVTVNVSSPKSQPPMGWVLQGDYVSRKTSFSINATPVVPWASPDGDEMPDKDATKTWLGKVFTGPVGAGNTVHMDLTISTLVRGKRMFVSYNGPPPQPHYVPEDDYTFVPYFLSKYPIECTGTVCTPSVVDAPIHGTYGDVLVRVRLKDGTPITNATVIAVAPLVNFPAPNPPQFGVEPGHVLNYARQEILGGKGTGKYSFAFDKITRAEPPNSTYCNSTYSQYFCEPIPFDINNKWGLRVMGDGAGGTTFEEQFTQSNTPGRLTYAIGAYGTFWRPLEHGNGVQEKTFYWSQAQEITSGERPELLATIDPDLETPRCEDPNDCGTPNPVDPSSGTVFLDQSDVAIPGLGGGLSFSRSYNHQGSQSGQFGKGWRHNYERRVVVDAWANVDNPATRTLALRYIDGNGAVLYYSDPDQDGVYTRYGNPDSKDRLTRGADLLSYRRTLADDSYEDFNSQGQLVRVVDTLGRTTTLTYEPDTRYSDPASHPGRLIEVAAPDGRKLSFTYSPGSGFPGAIGRISGPAGLIADYSYTYVLDPTVMEQRFQLASVTYADGRGHRFGYDDQLRLITVSDLTGVVTDHHEYTSDNKASLSETNSGRNRYSMTYAGNTTTLTDANGNVTVVEYEDTIAGKRLKKRTNCGFCGSASGTEEWEHDPQGRVTKHIDVEGHETLYQYENGELSEVVNPLGRSTTYTNYDDKHRPGTISPQGLAPTNVGYVPEGISSITRGAGGLSVSYANQRLSGIATAGGLNYAFTVNDYGETTAATDPRGKTRHMTYDKLGFLASIEEPDGQVTSFGRDARGRVLSETRPDGKVRRYTYNAAGQTETVTDEANRTTRYAYDAHGLLIRVFDPAGQRTEFEYDLMSDLTILRDAKGQETRFKYDNVHRVIEKRDPMGGIETYDYWPSGRLKSQKDRKNVTTNYTYDAIGRLLTRTHSDTLFALNVIYDDNARTVTAANGYDTLTWNFDTQGRLISEHSQKNSSTVSYQYNADDQRILMDINTGGQPVATQYSYTGGLLDAIVRTGTGASRTWTFGYDDVGMRTSMSLPNGLSTSYSFDPATRWLKEVKTMNGTDPVMSASYTHDEVGNRQSKALLEGVETYGYDVLDRLTKAARPSAAEQGWAYDQVGNRTMSEVGGIARDAEFDVRNRLSSSGATGSLLVSGSTDEASNVLVNGQPAIMLADNHFERRVPYSTAGPQSVTVAATDSTGNVRTSQYEVNVQSDAASYSYDANGSLIQKVEGGHTWTYTWNSLGELTDVWKDGVRVATMIYDPVGRRIEKVAIDANPSLTVATEWAYDGMDILREKVTTSSAVSYSYYVHGPGIDEPLGKETATTWEYFHADGLGSVVKVSDQSGAVVHSYAYDAWGNIEAGASRPGYAFTGREWDPETGLYYYRARYYDPKAGRFLSEDPIEFAGGDVNFYAYVFSAPTNWYDAFGLKANINLFTALDARIVEGKLYDPYAAGELYENPDGAYTVVGHGARNRIGTLDPNGLTLSPLELAARILSDKDFHGQPIIILACNTGTGTDSDPSFAERVLHEIVYLRRRSQTVVGYDETLINQNASPTIKGTGEKRFHVGVPGAPW